MYRKHGNLLSISVEIVTSRATSSRPCRNCGKRATSENKCDPITYSPTHSVTSVLCAWTLRMKLIVPGINTRSFQFLKTASLRRMRSTSCCLFTFRLCQHWTTCYLRDETRLVGGHSERREGDESSTDVETGRSSMKMRM